MAVPARIYIGPDDKIWADIPYANGDGPVQAKRIPGVRPKFEANKTNPNGKDKFVAWTYPKDMNTCRRFREVFGRQLKVDDALKVWAKQEVDRENARIALAKSDGNDIHLPNLFGDAPNLAEALENRKYQKVGAKFILDGGKVIIADQPGLGKTLMTLAALVSAGVRLVLVFAPKTAMETVWGREIERWTGARVFVAVGTTKQREETIQRAVRASQDLSDQMSVLVCNPEMVRTKRVVSCVVCGGADEECSSRNHITTYEHKFVDLFMQQFDAVIVDECHKSLIGKNAMSKNVSQTRLGMMLLPVKLGGYKVALSGTPYRGKPELLWGIMNWLRPDVFTSFWRWVESYFEVFEGYSGSRIIGEMMEDRLEAYDRTVAPYLLRRTKEEVAPDLPPKMYGGTPLDPDDPDSPVGVWLEMEPAQRKLYDQMAQESEAAIDGGLVTAIGVLPEMTRLKQFAVCSWEITKPFGEGTSFGSIDISPKPLPSNKYNWLLEFVNERAEEGGKIVVASQYTKVINAFAAQLRKDGHPCHVLTGETKQLDRKVMVADFQDNADSPKVFLINTTAGGVAITLDAADDVVFLDETYIPDDQEQVEDRCHRVSRPDHQVTIWYLRSLGTIEESICRITAEREATVKERLDGARGVDFAKRLLHLTHEDNRRRIREGR